MGWSSGKQHGNSGDWAARCPCDQGDQPAKYSKIRTKALEMAQVIVENTPASADQTAAIRLLREAVMTANAAVALEGLV